jgi:hypothetical protein
LSEVSFSQSAASLHRFGFTSFLQLLIETAAFCAARLDLKFWLDA